MSRAALEAAVRPLDRAAFVTLRAHARAAGSVFERDGCSLYGLGRALVLPLSQGLSDSSELARVTDVLASLPPPGTPTEGLPVALGALPFRPDDPAELVVPSLALTEGRGGALAVLVAEPGGHDRVLADALSAAEATRASGPHLLPDAFRLASSRPHADFLERVGLALNEVRSGRLDKVVLAREVVVEANRPFVPADLLERLRALHPSCTTFHVDGFLGATPELLVRRRSDELASDPLAGTAPRSGDPEADRRGGEALLASAKERTEHRAVVEAIAAGFGPITAELEVPEPEIVGLRNVSHLRTRIRGRLARRPDGGLPSALEVLAAIHPTPAVAGTPVELALDYLHKCEELDRGRYAGAGGFVRADGDGEFHLGIRSAALEGSTARLMAGVGIVADSDPAHELRETQLKLQAVLAAAVRP